MSRGHGGMPRFLLRVFERLLPTPLGREACDELGADYLIVRARRGGMLAWLWCVAQLLRPGTWLLAYELRRAAGSGRGPFRGVWLDVKLGYRMLRKYPLLTLTGVVSISVAVGAVAGFFAFADNLLAPRLPLPDAGRLVGIQSWDVAQNRLAVRPLYDFGVWRNELSTVRELGAFERYQPNVILGDGRSVPALGSKITAAGMAVAHVAPLLGRPLSEADERAGGDDVVVIGFDIWQRLFDADPTVIGRSLRLGAAAHTIVGVMPQGFRFPFDDDLWVPLRADPEATAPGEGPIVNIVGRLAEGVTLEQARAEIGVLGRRLAAELPDTHANLTPRVLPYGPSVWGGPTYPFRIVQIVLVLLLLVVCANVGALVYARNATRLPEVTVRRALGASRGRILTQLIVEAAVLASVGAVLGVVFARWGLGAVSGIGASATTGGTLGAPYWFDWELTTRTWYQVAGLTGLVALVVGLLPAIKLTREPAGKHLQRAGRSAVATPFGPLTKLAITLQVGLCVGLLAVASGQLPRLLRMSDPDVGGVSGRYLTARLQPDQIPSSGEDVRRATIALWREARELARRLREEQGVEGVALASAFPGMSHPARLLEVADGAGPPRSVTIGRVDESFFDGMGAHVVAGRGLDAGDVAPDGGAMPVAVANESFVRRVLGGANALGRQVRFLQPGSEPGPWLEIVGVVEDLGMNVTEPDSPEGLYLPIEETTFPVGLAVRLPATPEAFEARLRAVAAEVDPTLRVLEVRSLDAVVDAALVAQRWAYFGVLLATLATLGLSLSGVYAMTSFVVAQRTREIGVRVALGATSRQIVVAVLRGALMPAVFGLALGVVLAAALGSALSAGGLGTAMQVAPMMSAAVLLACVVPTRRALRIQPTQAIQAGL